MKLSLFKKLIRDVIREELDYKFSRLEEKLNEVVVSNNINYIKEDKSVRTQDRTYRNLMEEESIQPNTNRISNNNVSVPKTNNKVLDSLLAETAQGDEWKSINKEASTKSVQDNVQQLPDHLANAECTINIPPVVSTVVGVGGLFPGPVSGTATSPPIIANAVIKSAALGTPSNASPLAAVKSQQSKVQLLEQNVVDG